MGGAGSLAVQLPSRAGGCTVGLACQASAQPSGAASPGGDALQGLCGCSRQGGRAPGRLGQPVAWEEARGAAGKGLQPANAMHVATNTQKVLS